MPNTACGHAYSNSLTIPNVGVFPLNPEDTRVSKENGDQRIQVKVGTFVDGISSTRLKFTINLYQVPRSVYEQILSFAETDIINYISSFSGNVSLNLSGHTIEGGVIKKIDIPEGSFIEPQDLEEVEMMEVVTLEVYANTLSWI